MTEFWVIGGEYTDTHFDTLVPGKKLERLGPFKTYEEAHKTWQARARATIDDCQIRYAITTNPPQEGEDLPRRALAS
jgi:hypothetical protein